MERGRCEARSFSPIDRKGILELANCLALAASPRCGWLTLFNRATKDRGCRVSPSALPWAG